MEDAEAEPGGGTAPPESSMDVEVAAAAEDGPSGSAHLVERGMNGEVSVETRGDAGGGFLGAVRNPPEERSTAAKGESSRSGTPMERPMDEHVAGEAPPPSVEWVPGPVGNPHPITGAISLLYRTFPSFPPSLWQDLVCMMAILHQNQGLVAELAGEPWMLNELDWYILTQHEWDIVSDRSRTLSQWAVLIIPHKDPSSMLVGFFRRAVAYFSLRVWAKEEVFSSRYPDGLDTTGFH